MRPDDRLTVTEVAALLEVRPGTWRVWVHRGKAPEPDGRLDGRTPFWYRSTVAPLAPTGKSCE